MQKFGKRWHQDWRRGIGKKALAAVIGAAALAGVVRAADQAGAAAGTVTTSTASAPATSRPAQTPVLAANSVLKKDIDYGTDPLQKLDIYSPAKADHAAVVIFIHGGEWSRGDKQDLSTKPKFLNENGIVLVSANYRLSPQDKHPAQVNDVAAAIGWVHGHIGDFGGDPEKIVIMGYSAGCHLAALVSLDPQPLARVGMKPADIRGTVEWSGAMYDLAEQVKLGGTYPPFIKATFGEDEASQKAASPMAYVRNAKNAPPFLIASVDDAKQQSARDASKEFLEAINGAGGKAQAALLAGRTHGSASQDLGAAGDTTWRVLLDFIHSVTR